MAESKSVVIAALIANGAIAILKFLGYLLTGSPAMLSETYHSISDTGNQVFLLIGIRYSGREADREHPFGYGKAQFFYSFLVAVLLFGIAGWESAKHGYNAVLHGETAAAEGTATLLGFTFPGVWVNYTVLIAAILFEAYAFRKAYQGLKAEMKTHGWDGFVETFKKTSEVSTLTAFTEDAIAMGGAGIALFGIYLTRVTGNYIYDAVSALLIGLLLMGFAVALAWENKRLILGESLPADEERWLRETVANSEGVSRIVDFRTVFFGPGELLVTADVAFDSDLDTAAIDERISAIEADLVELEPQVRKVYVEPERPTDGAASAA
jgi:cation diffusion facilitator family transporter